MFITLFGMDTEVSLIQLLKVLSFISVIPFPKLIFANEVQLENTEAPILVTLEGMKILFKLVQLAKADAPMVITFVGIKI
jgi:hypothetical protein